MNNEILAIRFVKKLKGMNETEREKAKDYLMKEFSNKEMQTFLIIAFNLCSVSN